MAQFVLPQNNKGQSKIPFNLNTPVPINPNVTDPNQLMPLNGAVGVEHRMALVREFAPGLHSFVSLTQNGQDRINVPAANLAFAHLWNARVYQNRIRTAQNTIATALGDAGDDGPDAEQQRVIRDQRQLIAQLTVQRLNHQNLGIQQLRVNVIPQVQEQYFERLPAAVDTRLSPEVRQWVSQVNDPRCSRLFRNDDGRVTFAPMFDPQSRNIAEFEYQRHISDIHLRAVQANGNQPPPNALRNFGTMNRIPEAAIQNASPGLQALATEHNRILATRSQAYSPQSATILRVAQVGYLRAVQDLASNGLLPDPPNYSQTRLTILRGLANGTIAIPNIALPDGTRVHSTTARARLFWALWQQADADAAPNTTEQTTLNQIRAQFTGRE